MRLHDVLWLDAVLVTRLDAVLVTGLVAGLVAVKSVPVEVVILAMRLLGCAVIWLCGCRRYSCDVRQELLCCVR